MEAIDVIKNLFSIWLIIIASLSYCYFVSAKLPKGILRVISLIPIFIIFTILPFHLCSIYAILATSLCITWLCSFKLLLFAFEQGPLSWPKSKLSLPIFITMAALPIKLKESKHPQLQMHLPSNLAIQLLLFALSAELLINYRGILSEGSLCILYALFSFFLVDILFSFSFLIGKLITGSELVYPSSEPFLSASVKEFWGRRWSVPVSDTLRHTIYFPVQTALENVMGKGLVPKCLGVMAAFLVSGLMHELMYYQMTLGAISWDVTLYFVINGVAVSIEIILKKKFKGKLRRLPSFVSGPLTIGFVLATSWHLHFPQLIRTGADVNLFNEFTSCVEYLKTKVLDSSSHSGVNLS